MPLCRAAAPLHPTVLPALPPRQHLCSYLCIKLISALKGLVVVLLPPVSRCLLRPRVLPLSTSRPLGSPSSPAASRVTPPHCLTRQLLHRRVRVPRRLPWKRRGEALGPSLQLVPSAVTEPPMAKLGLHQLRGRDNGTIGYCCGDGNAQGTVPHTHNQSKHRPHFTDAASAPGSGFSHPKKDTRHRVRAGAPAPVCVLWHSPAMPSATLRHFLLPPKHRLCSKPAGSSGTSCTAPHKGRFSEGAEPVAVL